MLSGEAANANHKVFGLNPRYTTLEAITLTLMRLCIQAKVHSLVWNSRNLYMSFISVIELPLIGLMTICNILTPCILFYLSICNRINNVETWSYNINNVQTWCYGINNVQTWCYGINNVQTSCYGINKVHS